MIAKKPHVPFKKKQNFIGAFISLRSHLFFGIRIQKIFASPKKNAGRSVTQQTFFKATLYPFILENETWARLVQWMAAIFIGSGKRRPEM